MEETVIRMAAPTLAGIKTGSLFPYYYESREELGKEMDAAREAEEAAKQAADDTADDAAEDSETDADTEKKEDDD